MIAILDETFVPNAELLHIYAEVYKDPSNMDPASDLEFRYEQDELWFRGDGAEEPIKPLDKVSFLSSLGLIELSFRRMEKYQRLYWVRPRVITV